MTIAIRQAVSLGAIALSAVLWTCEAVLAQSDAAIPEATLREPWVRQLAVLESVSDSVGIASASARAPLGEALAGIEAAIAAYEERVDRVIDRVVGDPQFAYVATEISEKLSVQVAEVHVRFDALYTLLGVRDRDDVGAAQASLDRLRRTLEAGKPFETDVLSALGSGSRTRIVELATRWWNGEERAIAVKKRAAELRQKLDAGSAIEEPH